MMLTLPALWLTTLMRKETSEPGTGVVSESEYDVSRSASLVFTTRTGAAATSM
jgi:hypothetical protein